MICTCINNVLHDPPGLVLPFLTLTGRLRNVWAAAGWYNSTFISDRGTEQQVKISGQVGLFTERRGN